MANKVNDSILVFLTVGIMLTFIVWIGAITGSEFLLVFVGLAPTVIYVVTIVYLIERNVHNKPLLWLMPLFLGTFFNIIGNYSKYSVIRNMEITQLTFLNLLIMYTFAGILSFIGVDIYRSDLRRLKKEKAELKKELNQLTNDNLEEYIQSIEDKAKALNFVIGRVYSNRNGGSKQIRNRLKIKSEWYNEFSTLDFANKERAGILIKNILNRLNQLFSKEKDIIEIANLKNLKRNPDGEDVLIDILIRNDKDPTRTYFESAMDFCLKIKEFLGE